MEKSQLDLLVKHINEFDCYYEMSDSSSSYMANRTIEVKINQQLNSLEQKDLDYVLDNLNENGKESFKRYFTINDNKKQVS